MTTYSKILMMGVAVTALMASDAWAQSNPRVGIVSAVNPAATGTPPNADTRPIVIGSDVIFRERVVTTGDGQAQLMFLDQSTMMIGPNSQVVIDEFVYDPNTSSGAFAATLTQGSFRYIGGKLSKQGNATLKTPVATIGIRGSDVIVNHSSANNSSNVQNIHGNATVQSNGSTVKLPTGFGTQVNGPGASPSYPSELTAAIINAAKAAFEGQPGKNAGAPVVPQNNDVERSGLPGTVQAAALAAIQPAAGGLAGATPPPQVNNQAVNLGNTTTAQGSQNSQALPNGETISGNPLNAAGSQFSSQQPNVQPNNPSGPGQPGNPGQQPGNAQPSGFPQPGPNTIVQNGYVAGMNQTLDGNSSSSYAVRNTSADSVIVHVNPPMDSNQGSATARLGYSGVGTPTAQNFTVDLGYYPDSATDESVAFGSNSFYAFSRNNPRTINTSGGTLPVSAIVNGVESGSSMVMVTIDNSTIGSLPGVIGNIENVNVCTCEFMSWGLWGGVTFGPGAQGQGRLDSALGTFVTGVLPNVSVEPTGAASFAGHAVGISSRAPTTWTAGNANVSWNFGTRSGNMQITNFDGNNMRADIAAPSDWRHFSGALTPMDGHTGPASAGAANGSFFVAPGAIPGTQPAGAGGNFTMTGANGYNAQGVFVTRNTSLGGPNVLKSVTLK